ncbi:WD domain, G-beta repeat-containing protein, putative [Eimeria brunetti]|uniref:WD domain, G-beta repeat-containing protein, putative n=1 Tax=Eimeria brunetti TaxID=51314 RepID=U6LHQ1_9EIME|nr:WD domain, G-beta repeat-containing protein, putative [Eimeria brunetti]
MSAPTSKFRPAFAYTSPSCFLQSFLGHSGIQAYRRYLLSSSRDGSIALYDLEADAAWNLNGGFGPEPKVYPIGYVQRVPDRPPKRNLLPLRFQPASGRRVVRGRAVQNDAGDVFDFAGSKTAQAGHSRSVTSVEFMPGDNGLFVSTGLDKLLKIWDTQAWDCVLGIAVESPILCCAFDRVGFQSNTALSSKLRSSMGSMEHPVEPPAHLALAAGCEDGSVRIFDMRCGVAQQTLLGHKGAVLSVTWDPVTPCQLFSGSSDKSIRKWDIRRNDACVVIFDKGKPDIDFFRATGIGVNGNPTSNAIVVGQLLSRPVGPRKAGFSFPGDACGNFGGLEDRCIDRKSCFHSGGAPASTLKSEGAWSDISAHEGAVTCLVPTPDGAYLVSSGIDGRIRLWNAFSGSHCFVHMVLNIPRVNSVVPSAQEARRSRMPGITGGPAKSKAASNRCGLIWGVQAAMSRSGEYLIHGRGRVLCTFDIMSGAELQITAPGYTDDIVCVTWNDEKNEAYSGASDGSILIYDAMCGYTSEDTEEIDGEESAAVDVTPSEFLVRNASSDADG